MEKSKTLPNINKLEAQCIHISEMEKRAAKASRDSIKYMQCLYMQNKIGKIYKGIVSSVQDYGIFIELSETKTDCLVKTSNISGTWISDSANYQIKEYNTGEVIRLGDEVNVVISMVDVEKKTIDATLIRL